MRAMKMKQPRRPVPRMEPGTPDRPAMSDNAKREWFRLLPVLLDGNMVTPGDGDALAEMCELQARLSELRPLIDNAKADSRDYSRFLNQDLRIGSRLLKLWDKFGMTPMARTRIARYGQ